MKTTREKLLLIAFKLFLTKGYAQTSMVDLAKASGLSKGAFHHYFPRKHDIFEASIKHFFGDYLPDEEPDENISFEDYARQCGARYAQGLVLMLKHQIPLAAYQAFVWSMVRDNPQDFQARYEMFLARLVGLCSARDAEGVSRGLIAVIEGTGNAVSLEVEIEPEGVVAAFEAAVDGFLGRM